jgi:DNA-binding transcriptional ArsR family regulator
MVYVGQHIRYTPVGEYLRLIILRRLARGPASVEEVNELAKNVVEKLSIRYDWRVWPYLVLNEVEIRDGTAAITQRGRWLLELTSEEIAKYVERTLGVAP